MKKSLKFIHFLLVFAITTFIFYFITSSSTDISGFGGLVPSIVWSIVWGPIFLYFLIRKLTTRKLEDTESLNKNKGHSISISLVITIIVFTSLVLWFLGVFD